MPQIFNNNPFLLVILMVWSITWKGLALWRAAKRTDKIWFVILMILNTVGILEIIYLTIITNKKITSWVEKKFHTKA